MNTIEGLTEELATSIVTQAETMAEEQTDELPRRKAGRVAAALVENRDGGDQPPADLAGGGEVDAGSDESEPADGEPAADGSGNDELTDSTGKHDSALPAEQGEEVEDGSSFDEETESESEPEVDEASDDEYHDLALAEETSGLSAHGHEVTSPPSDEDQSETSRIVTDVVENGETPPTTSKAKPEPRVKSRPENGPSGQDQTTEPPSAGV